MGLSKTGDIATPPIAMRTDFQDAIAAGQGVTEYAPTSKAAEEARELWKSVRLKMNPKQKEAMIA